MEDEPIHRLSAFSNDPSGGNPAGVWIGRSFPSNRKMLEIAADVGYSETVFAIRQGSTLDVRYFSPEDEVAFCGHATIALGVLLGQQSGEREYELNKLEESPSAEWHGKGITTRQAAAILRDYDVRPTQIRIGGRSLKGYDRDSFAVAWDRYVPVYGPSIETTETTQ